MSSIINIKIIITTKFKMKTCQISFIFHFNTCSWMYNWWIGILACKKAEKNRKKSKKTILLKTIIYSCFFVKVEYYIDI